MGTGVKAILNLALEQTGVGLQGEQVILPLTAVAGTMSLTNGIPATPASGYRLHVYVQQNTATGTITIAGKDINGNTISEVIPPTGSIPVQDPNAQNNNVGSFEWLSANVFGSTTATSNAVTTTGLTGGSIKIGAVAAGKFLQPIDFDFAHEPEQFSPDEMRGSYDRDFINLQLRRIAILSKADQDLYADTSLWFWYMICNPNPTITTLPATPTVLKVSTAVLTTPQSLTTQPSAPGMKLQFVLTAVGATGTIIITGTDINGLAQTETINVANIASQTVYSANVYGGVNANGIAYTGMTGGSAAINGVYGFQYVFLPSVTDPQTASFEFFTGTDSGVLPFGALSEGSLDWAVDKVGMLSGVKGIAQDYIPIGVRTSAILSTSQVVSLGQPTEQPLVGTNSSMWIDPITGTPATTLFNDLISAKIDFKHDVIGKWTTTSSGATPACYNRVYRKKRETIVTATIDFTNNAQIDKFIRNVKQYWAFQWFGRNIGGGNSKSVQVICPVYIQKPTRKPGVDKENVEADFEVRCFYDSGIGATYKVIVITQTPPGYPS